jgi:RHS repeat-associated protein
MDGDLEEIEFCNEFLRNEAELAKAFVDSNQLVDYLNENWPDGPSDPDFEEEFIELVELNDEETPPAEEPFENEAGTTEKADPVFMFNGEYIHSTTDLFVAGRSMTVEIKRTYGSRREYNSRFGYDWDMNYNMKVRRLVSVSGDPNVIIVLDGEGHRREYVQHDEDPNLFTRGNDHDDYLYDIDGILTLISKSGIEHRFDENGNLEAIYDRNDNFLTFSYDSNGLMDLYGPSYFFNSDSNGKYGLVAKEYMLSSITDDLGRSINLTYDSNGLLSTITDFAGRTWTYSYDPYSNDLVAVEDPNGFTTTYGYDAAHNLETITDANGQTYITNHYDILKDNVAYQDYGYGTYTFDYNEAINIATLIDRQEYVTKMLYSDSGQVLSETIYTKDANDEPNAFTTSYQYDPNTLEMTWQFLPDGSCIYYTYDDLANLTGVYRKTGPNEPNNANEPNVITTLYTYDDTHIYDINSITDPMGNITAFEYDSNGNVKKIIYPAVPVYGQQQEQQPVIEYTYNSYGQVETVTSPDGIVTEYVYYDDSDNSDPNCGKLWKVIVDANETDGLKITTEYAYDAYGNVRLIKDPNGDSTTFQYNQLNLLTQTISPLDYVTEYEYNKNKKLQQITREITNEPNQVTSYTYDILDHLKTVTDPCGFVTTYGYNKSEEPNIVIDAEENDTVSVYNERGLLTAVIGANGNTTRYTYTTNGDINDINDAKGNVTSYNYDGFGRLTMITYPDDNNEQFTYDKNSNVLTKTNRKGQTITYEYDAMNRLTSKSRESDPDTYFSYDIAGRVAEVNDLRSTSQGGGVTSFGYDRIGRVKEVNDIESRLVSYEYEDRGLRTELVYPDDSNVTYEYDSMSRLKKVKYNGSLVAEYEYDELSRRTLLTLGNDANTVYEYDIADKLRKITNNVNDINIVYAYNNYDEIGNCLSLQIDDANAFVFDYDELYRLVLADYNDGYWMNYYYDELGNRTSTYDGTTVDYSLNSSGLNQYNTVGSDSYTYNTNGCLEDDNTYKYYYDCENRLVDVNDQSNNSVASYSYDYAGRRISKTVDSNTIKYAYDGQQVIAEYENDTLVRKFIYGAGIDEPLAMINVSDNNAVYYYHADRLGSIIAITDSAGNIVEKYDYDVFGSFTIYDSNVSQISESSIDNPYYFTGRRFDTETENYYYRARYYKPNIGRFLQPDPIGYYHTMNLYQYCLNSPLNYTDPIGMYERKTAFSIAKVKYITNDGKVHHATVASAATFKHILMQQKFAGQKITFFEYTGHGFEEGEGLYVGHEGIWASDITGEYKDLIKSAFDPQATIELEACQGARGNESIAHKFKEVLPDAKVYGYTGNALDLYFLDETIRNIKPWGKHGKWVEVKLQKCKK